MEVHHTPAKAVNAASKEHPSATRMLAGQQRLITDLRSNLENELGDLKRQMENQQQAFKEQMDRLVGEQRRERQDLAVAEK